MVDIETTESTQAMKATQSDDASAPRYPLARPLAQLYPLTIVGMAVCTLALAAHFGQRPTDPQASDLRVLRVELERETEEVAALKAGLRDIERVVHLPPAQREEADRLLGPMRVSRMNQ